MTQLHDKALKTALNLLNGIGCQFKVITMEGIEYGGLVVVPQRKKRDSARRPKVNDFSSIHYQDILKDVQPGSAAAIPYPSNVNPEHLRKAIAGHLSTNWGTKSYMTAVDASRNIIEVLRY